ncbi:MAG: M48 family metallopeptidase [Candidatus Berkelbacteria bacterium]|nr:MAG: M48 family metallopeptidase [Candidatus Berkelbacteria bacterium]QQG51984.1 MAG: M48 family metallopeptidase [Candidatus Berkelbacteria bacterium]
MKMPDRIKVKRLRRSRHLRLKVFHDGSVVVTAPLRAPQKLIEDFILEHENWIEEKLSEATTRLNKLTAEQEKLFFRGQEYDFRLNVSNDVKSGVKIDGRSFIVSSLAEDHDTVRKILEKFYRREAEKRFRERVPLLADLVGRDVVKVTIRDQRTRWGSCSSRNTLSLNWRLIMAPDSVSDYVIYHELSHLTHMNHSERFWALVESYDKNYKASERWLKKHHNLLHF